MRTFQYYLSGKPVTPAPASSELSFIEAKSTAEVALQLASANAAVSNRDARWVHVLVWTSKDGKQRGFESLPLPAWPNSDHH